MNHTQVREIVAVLDLDVLFYPCPKNGPNFRPKVAQMGGKQQFPYMVRYYFFPLIRSFLLIPHFFPPGLVLEICAFVCMKTFELILKKSDVKEEFNLNICFWFQVDPNTGVAMYESDEIIKYLVGKYGTCSYIINILVLSFFVLLVFFFVYIIFVDISILDTYI